MNSKEINQDISNVLNLIDSNYIDNSDFNHVEFEHIAEAYSE